MFNGLTQDELAAALLNVPAVELEAINLLREHPAQPGNLFPTGIAPEVYTNATIEMVKYSRACADLATRMRLLPSQALAIPDDDLIGGFSL